MRTSQLVLQANRQMKRGINIHRLIAFRCSTTTTRQISGDLATNRSQLAYSCQATIGQPLAIRQKTKTNINTQTDMPVYIYYK